MAIFNAALLAALLPAAFAVPHAHQGHIHLKRNNLPSGYSSGFPQPSGVPSSAPYPVANSTAVGPTGSGSIPLSTGGAGGGPITIQSTINIVPLPQTKTDFGSSPASTGVPGSGSGSGSGSESGSGSGSGSESGSNSGSGSGSGGVGENGASCGPATVTVTQANTITITVPGSSPSEGGSSGGSEGGSQGGSQGGSGGAPGQSASVAPSVSAVPSAPYPIGNSSIPVGPSGTGSVGTGVPSVPSQTPISQTPASQTPVVSSSTPVAASSAPVQAASSAAPVTSAPVSSPAAPIQAASSAPQSSSVEVKADYHVPGGYPHQSSAAPVVAAPVSSSTPASPVQEASSAAPVVSSPAPVSSAASSSAPAQSSTTPSTSSNSGVKPRGLLYGGDIGTANSYLSASGGNIGWGANWDSSPQPESGAASGTLSVQFVPQMLGLDQVHVDAWKTNAKGPYLMAFNEPDKPKSQGGSEMDVGTCVSSYMQYMQPHAGSSKLISPSTTNDLNDANVGIQYMSDFLDQCKAQGCQIDVLGFHYYGDASDLPYFKNTVSQYQALQQKHGIAELWITEMAPNQAPTEDQMKSFLEFLDDSSSGVSRYAFNGLNTGTGQSLTEPAIQSCYQS